MTTNDQPLTKENLLDALESFSTEIRSDVGRIRQEMHQTENRLVSNFHTELDEKLARSEGRIASEFREALDEREARITRTLMDHTEEVVAASEANVTRILMNRTEEVIAANNTELLSLTTDVFQPAQSRVSDHKVRIRRLERAATRKHWTPDNA